METRDLAIEYKALYKEINSMLKNIKEIGFNVDAYFQELKEINNRVSGDIKSSNDYAAYAKMYYEQGYAGGIGELKKLKNHLDKYNCYFIAFNSCELIKIRIKDTDITNNQLEKFVSEMIYNLKLIVSSDTIDYDVEKHIVDMVYEVAYELIKLELIKTGKSELYSYVSNQKENVAYFDELIKKDIEALNLDDGKNRRLIEKLYERKKTGIDATFFDIDIIKGIIANTNAVEFRKTNIDNLTNIADELKQTCSRIDDYLTDIEETNEHIVEQKKRRRGLLSEIRTRIISLVVACTLLTGGGVFAVKSIRDASFKKVYKATTETSSSYDDRVMQDEEQISYPYSSEEPQDEATIRIYDPYISEYYRGYVEYDVSDVNLGSDKDYFTYDVTGEVPAPKVLDANNGDDISDYQDAYREVVLKKYEYIGETADAGLLVCATILVGFVYFIYIVLMEFVNFLCTNADTIFEDSFCDISVDISELKKLTYKEDIILLKEKIAAIMVEINKNEVLRDKFNELYEQNKHLLDNPEELIKMVDNTKDKKVLARARTLVRDNKRKG